MNIASAQMFQDSLQNLGNTFRANRQLDAENAFRQAQLENEAKRTQVEQSFRDAQMQHYNTMEEHQADSADAQNKRLDAIEKKYGVQSAYQDLLTAQGNITKGMQGLSLDKSLPPEEKTAYLQQSIDGLPDTIKTSMLQNPQIKALYDGEGDWDAVAAAVQQHQAGKMGATDLQIKDWQAAQAAADSEDDPQLKSKLQAVADMYKSNLPAALKTTTPAVAPKPTINKSLQYGPDGKLTNSVTSFAMPPGATGSPAPGGTGGGIPVVNSQDDYDALPVGQQYKDSGGRLAVKKPQQPIPGGGGFQISMPGAPTAPGQ